MPHALQTFIEMYFIVFENKVSKKTIRGMAKFGHSKRVCHLRLSRCRRYRCPSDYGMRISHMANIHFDFEQQLQRHSTRTSQKFTGQHNHYLPFVLHD
jgi:hypothetical protein